MLRPVLLLGGAALFLAGCDAPGVASGPSGSFVQLSEGVLAIAAPYQDLTSVKIDPADGCYVYRHVGPVETTYLPLRAKNGQPICTRGPDEAAAS
jgi:hypothetical protein